MNMIKLDKIDIKILEKLQKVGRIANIELAEEVGLSESACWKRINRMEKEGIIKNYQANIDLNIAIQPTTIFVEVNLESNTLAEKERFEKRVLELPEVIECYAMQGKMDYLLKIIVPKFSEYPAFIEPVLNGDYGVNQLVSSIAVQPIKNALPDLSHLLKDS